MTRIMTGPSNPTTRLQHRIEFALLVRGGALEHRVELAARSRRSRSGESSSAGIGGSAPSERPMGAPSRTRTAASSTAAFHRQVGDDLTGDAQRLEHRNRAGRERAQACARNARCSSRARPCRSAAARSRNSCQRRRLDSMRSERGKSQIASPDRDEQVDPLVAHEVAARDQHLGQQRQLGLAVAEHLDDLSARPKPAGRRRSTTQTRNSSTG